MIFRFIGTSDSAGIPVHNCTCKVCDLYRKEGKENLSTCAYLESNNGDIILLDAGIENISSTFDGKKIKAVFLTHFHADHCLGLLRLRYSSDKINCYHPKDKEGFADIFKHKKSLFFIENIAFKPYKVNEFTFYPIPLKHSKNTTGYLIQDDTNCIAYLTDCAGIEEKSMEFLMEKNIDICYLDACLAPNFNNGNHLNYEQASGILKKIGAKESYFIHASHFTLEYIKSNNIKTEFDYILPQSP